MTDRAGTPLVSVIVPVRDDEDGLERLVAHLQSQTISPERFEIIVADDGSRVPATVSEPPDGMQIRVTRDIPSGSFAARNRAAALARGPVLAFTDADCRPAPEWLERGLAATEDNDFVAGRVEPRLPDQCSIWSLIELSAWHDVERVVRRGGAVTANLFVRTELFRRLSGFDGTRASGGDFEFAYRCLAAGAEGAFAPDVVVEHAVEDSALPVLRRMWFRHVWAGRGSARAGQRPERTGLRYLIPGSGIWRRRTQGLTLGLDRERIRQAGLPVTRSSEIRACLLRDLVLPYLVWTAQLIGWWWERNTPR